MQISGITNFITPNYKDTSHNIISNPRNILRADSFEHTSSINFTANGKYYTETTYKKIEGVHDPYSDVIMISEPQFEKIKKQIYKHPAARDQLAILSRYYDSMFEPEKEIYNMLKKEYLKTAKKDKQKIKEVSFKKILEKAYPKANNKIKPEEQNIIDKMEVTGLITLSEDTQDKLKNVLNNLRDNVEENTFRIKPSIQELYTLKKHIPEKEALQEIIDLSAEFPRSINSSDVFILKNKDKSSEEIALSLLKPALVSIEHIKPASKGGEDSSANYLIASQRMNNYRSSKTYEEFISEFPNIPECCQRYADDLISKRNCVADLIKSSLPNVKVRLYKESQGKININVDKLDPNIQKDNDDLCKKLNKLILQFSIKQ